MLTELTWDEKIVKEEERLDALYPDVCDMCNGTGWVTIQTAPDDEHTRLCECSLPDSE